jgi:hypothetical protein
MISNNDIFVDTGAWVALADKDDAHHSEAVSLFPDILNDHRSLITSNLVIAESYILILHNLGYKAAIQYLDGIKASPRIRRICSTEGIEAEAEGILKKYVDQDFSYTDAVSFAIMKIYKVYKAFGFDSHFSTAGFTKTP